MIPSHPISFAVALVVLASALASPAIAGQSIMTAHYDLYTEVADVDELGRMVEALHEKLKAFFKAEPPAGLLRVEIYASKKRFHDALRADKQPVVSAGGYYSPQTRKAYLWQQPSDYFTRHLLIHECTHQFHYLVATKNRSPRAEWYTEGLAEYFSMHNWDGKTLRVGVIPALSLEDYPAIATRQYHGALNRDFARLAAGKSACDRPVAWALVRFLIEREPAMFRDLAARLDGGVPAAGAWSGAAGERSGELAKAFEAYLADLHQPWTVVSIAWQERGDVLMADSKTTAMAILKKTPATLTAEIEPAAKGAWPGVVIGYHTTADYLTVQLLSDGKVRLARRKGDQWQPAEILKPLARVDRRNIISVERAGEKWVVRVNGDIATSQPAAGQVGIYVQSGTAKFRVTTR